MKKKNKSAREQEREDRIRQQAREDLAKTHARRKDPDSRKKRKDITDYSQELIPIKKISNGIIETSDRRYIKIIEVDPINFSLRSDEEQFDIIMTFAGFLKAFNVNIQFKSITKKADAEKYIEVLNADLEGETNERTLELSKSYIKLIRDVASNEALTRRFFMIFEYEPSSNSERSYDYQNIFRTLQMAAATAKKMLGFCGNHIVEPENPDQFLGEILYMFFNRRSSLEETFRSRVERIISDTMKSKGLEMGVDEMIEAHPVHYICPRGIDLSHASYIVMDGLYYTFLYIKGNGYPQMVRSGWMGSIASSGEGIDIDVFFKKEDKNKIRSKLLRSVRLNKVKMNSTYETNSDFEEVRDAIHGGQYLKEGMFSGNEDLIQVCTLITISAETFEALNWKKREVMNSLRSADFEVGSSFMMQEKFLKSVMPFLDLDKEIYRKAHRNMLTSSAASAYMFSSFELCDEDGILIGVNSSNESLCVLDIFNTKMYKNANLVILGTSGSGKTFTQQLMALRMRMKQVQIFILAPLKGYEYKRACDNIGGQYIKLSPSSPSCINIMEIREPDREATIDIDGDGEEESLLASKIQEINTFFSLMVPDMTNEEEQIMDEAIIMAYAKKGITHDNASIYEKGTKNLKEMPVLGDIHAELSTLSKAKRLHTILQRFVVGSARSFNNQTNVDLENPYIVIDVSETKDPKILTLAMFVALSYVWGRAKEDRTKKKAIFLDETWTLIGESSNKKAAEFVLEIFKIIRGYGGAAIASTQNVSDFFALENGKYGKAIINNSKTKIILNMEDEEAQALKEVLGLTRVELRNIRMFDKGKGLISSNNNKVAVSIKASRKEEELITTDRRQLEAIREKKLKEKEIEQKRQMNEYLEEEALMDGEYREDPVYPA